VNGWPLLAIAGLAVATPAASWWIIGDLSTAPKELGLDYYLAPIDVAPAVEDAVGVGAVAAVLLALGALGWLLVKRRADVTWGAVAVLVMGAGFLAALGQRVATAGVIGANIGVGMFVVFYGPIFVLLVGLALVLMIKLLVRRCAA
jgi:hypothetical protein